MNGSPDSRSPVVREQWLWTTLYSGIKAGSIGFNSGLPPNAAVDDGRIFMGDVADVADAFLRVGISADGVLIASPPVHDVCEARGRPCV